MTNSNYFQPFRHQDFDNPAGGLALTTTSTCSTYSDHRFGAFDHGFSGAEQEEASSGCIYDGTQVHYMLIRNITVSKVTDVNLEFFNQIWELFLGEDGNAFRIKFSSKSSRVLSPIDVGNLCGSESNNVEVGIVPVEGIEVMEVPSCGANDDNILFH